MKTFRLDRGIEAPRRPLGSLRVSDLRGIARLATQATRGVARIAEGVHQSVWGTLGVPGGDEPAQARGLTGLVYKSVHGVAQLVGTSLDAALAWLELHFESAEDLDSDTPRREALLAVLNGVMGDRLAADESPFAIPMTLRYQGKAAAWANRDTQDLCPMPEATGKVLVLIHGLCVNDLRAHARHRGHEPDHGEALASALGYTPVYLRYNSGLPVAQNGRELSTHLERLVTHWPAPIEELTVIAHSMGGLLARSAVHRAREASMLWPDFLKKIVFLGTPHQGAPLEKAGTWVDVILGSTPYTAPFARLGRLRSAGITDLRYGNVLGEDRKRRESDRLQALPLPEEVACFTVAATLAAQRSALADRLVGDGLVPLHSALGHHDDPRRALPFADPSQWIAYRTGHMDLLTRPEITRQIVHWLTPAKA